MRVFSIILVGGRAFRAVYYGFGKYVFLCPKYSALKKKNGTRLSETRMLRIIVEPAQGDTTWLWTKLHVDGLRNFYFVFIL